MPGFWPLITIRSAVCTSSRLTEPLPIPMVSSRATEVDSWHMFEQSGRLLVPYCAGEELIDERRLVGGLAGGVEDRLVRAVQPGQRLADQRERVGPRDRLVVAGVAAAHHRVHDPPLLAQPVVAVLGQLGDAVLGEERRLQQVPRRLLRHRLRAVLAELGVVPLVRVRVGPRAPLAVEPVDLVEPGQGARGPHHSHRLDAALERHRHRRDPRRGVLAVADVDVAGLVGVGRGPGSGLAVEGHGLMRTRAGGDGQPTKGCADGVPRTCVRRDVRNRATPSSGET